MLQLMLQRFNAPLQSSKCCINYKYLKYSKQNLQNVTSATNIRFCVDQRERLPSTPPPLSKCQSFAWVAMLLIRLRCFNATIIWKTNIFYIFRSVRTSYRAFHSHSRPSTHPQQFFLSTIFSSFSLSLFLFLRKTYILYQIFPPLSFSSAKNYIPSWNIFLLFLLHFSSPLQKFPLPSSPFSSPRFPYPNIFLLHKKYLFCRPKIFLL